MLKKTTYFFIITGLFVLLIIIEHYAPEPVNWNYYFSASKKDPYGCKILRDMLPVSFNDHEILTNDESLYPNITTQKSTNTSNFMIITNQFNISSLDCNALLDFVKEGNHVFISALDYTGPFADTLNISSGHLLISVKSIAQKDKNNSRLYFVNPRLKTDSGYLFTKRMPAHYFNSFDTASSIVLGKYKKHLVNFIKTQYGNGAFYLHCQPLAFTNFHLLYSNHEYASKALSYLPVNTTIWDEYYKPHKIKIRTPLKFILLNPPLKMAYYITLLSILLYMLFEGRRKQRIVPILYPPRNDSVEFIRTVGKLFLHNHDHKDIAMKKFNYFNDYVRTNYYLSTNDIDSNFYNALSRKSGVYIELIREIYEMASNLSNSLKISKEQLNHFYKKIETFYSKSY